jgi:hypothetical protein
MSNRGRERGRNHGDRVISEPLNPNPLQSHVLRSFRRNVARPARFVIVMMT